VLTFFTVLGYSREDYQNVIAHIKSGAIQPKNMITRKISIDRVVEDGFEALIKDKNKHVKILVDLHTAS
jgi:threonine dehydrogenase-like Zn-dependent dehydrogenase